MRAYYIYYFLIFVILILLISVNYKNSYGEQSQNNPNQQKSSSICSIINSVPEKLSKESLQKVIVLLEKESTESLIKLNLKRNCQLTVIDLIPLTINRINFLPYLSDKLLDNDYEVASRASINIYSIIEKNEDIYNNDISMSFWRNLQSQLLKVAQNVKLSLNVRVNALRTLGSMYKYGMGLPNLDDKILNDPDIEISLNAVGLLILRLNSEDIKKLEYVISNSKSNKIKGFALAGLCEATGFMNKTAGSNIISAFKTYLQNSPSEDENELIKNCICHSGQEAKAQWEKIWLEFYLRLDCE